MLFGVVGPVIIPFIPHGGGIDSSSLDIMDKILFGGLGISLFSTVCFVILSGVALQKREYKLQEKYDDVMFQSISVGLLIISIMLLKLIFTIIFL